MESPAVVIGIGEMGSVFARGLLRAGHPVYPVTRHVDLQEVALALPAPELVLVAVAENALHRLLEALPVVWRDRAALLQNELLPRDWERHGLHQPTVISAWFEKKRGQDVRVLIPSPVYGPRAGLLQETLTTLDIPARVLDDPQALLFELVVKNVYILTTNCAGLITGGTVSELWERHRELATDVAHEVMRIQESLTGARFEAGRLLAAMLLAFGGDPDHRCTGRNAPARLERALQQAADAGIDVPVLRAIADRST
jgi:ketopantoate reductase